MYSKKWVNIISFVLAAIIFCVSNILWSQINNTVIANLKEETKEIKNDLEVTHEEDIKHTEEDNQEVKKVSEEEKIENWQIEIPSISLIAPIAEGTEKEILDQYVGHFGITSKKEGNIGLAAHNRGYPVNYFANLKNLKGGEEIIYTYGEFTKTYVVNQNIKISDIDWSYLENTTENKITLITCIANEPEYRRCVQAIEKN